MKNTKKKFISKIIILKLILILSLSIFIESNIIGTSHASETISVKVTEKIPGAGCVEEAGTDPVLYKCEVEKGFKSVSKLLGKIVMYFSYIASIGAVLYIIINGIIYTMGGADSSLKEESKKRIKVVLIGLIILLLSGVILNLIAPWIYTP